MDQNAKERKTSTLLGSDQIIHPYDGDLPQKVYVVGSPRQYENGEGEKKRYVQEFYGSYIKPQEGEADNKKRTMFRAEATEPFPSVAEHVGTGRPLMITGQTFIVAAKGKDGKPFNIQKTFVRSIKTIKTEKREKDGEVKEYAVGDKDIMPSSIAAKNEFYAANNRSLNGFINASKLNEPRMTKEGDVFAYRQFMYVGQNNKDTVVEFYTKEPVPEDAFAKGRRISMPGAMRLKNYFSKKTNKYVRQEIFEPNYIGVYKDREKEKEAEPVEKPALEAAEEKAAEGFAPAAQEAAAQDLPVRETQVAEPAEIPDEPEEDLTYDEEEEDPDDFGGFSLG